MAHRHGASAPGGLVAAVAVAAILATGLVLADPTPVAAAVEVSHGSRAVPVVALTIDDGFNAANCAAMADILRQKHAVATFFPTANAVARAPATWRRIAAMGFPIGNHTTSHRDLSTAPLPTAIWQIDHARRVIESIIGRPMIRVVRPPYGAWNGTTLAAAGAAGFPVVLLWDATFADTSRAPDAAHVRAAMRGWYGSVILLHCGPAASVRILADVIDAYRARGIGFVTVPTLLRLAVDPAAWAGFARAPAAGRLPLPSRPAATPAGSVRLRPRDAPIGL